MRVLKDMVLFSFKEKNKAHIAYYSRRTSEAESRHHSYELETLAVIRSVELIRCESLSLEPPLEVWEQIIVAEGQVWRIRWVSNQFES